jgi:hypothetical protein
MPEGRPIHLVTTSLPWLNSCEFRQSSHRCQLIDSTLVQASTYFRSHASYQAKGPIDVELGEILGSQDGPQLGFSLPPQFGQPRAGYVRRRVSHYRHFATDQFNQLTCR